MTSILLSKIMTDTLRSNITVVKFYATCWVNFLRNILQIDYIFYESVLNFQMAQGFTGCHLLTRFYLLKSINN